MEKSEGKYNLYKSPSSAALLTVVSAAITLFCISYTFNLVGKVGRLNDNDAELKTEIISLKKNIQELNDARINSNGLVVTPLSDDMGFSRVEEVSTDSISDVEDLGAIIAKMRADKTSAEVSTPVEVKKPKAGKAEVMSTAVSSPSIKVRQNDKTEMLSATKDNFGQILASNADSMRVMISRGGADGVEAAQRFVVYRNNEYIGIIEVDRVFSTMSACKQASSTPKGFRVGDMVCKEQAGRARTISGG